MPDYGHDLRFGSFVTPLAADPERTVALAVASEQAGLDLVTFQDHPYQPRFLDAVTLLAWVGARTSRIQLAANVHNLLLRPPGVLARTIASLDLLTGGRAALGLGAGGFVDAAVAMGAPRREGRAAGDALEEAVVVIRELWDTDARGGVFLDGEHHPIQGAKRGPAPAHPVPIWLGVRQPRGLRLVGRRADGWLPSLGWVGVDGLDAGNAVIDASAAAAGRDPRAIRRLLNIGPDVATPEILAELTSRQGVSTFILASDDEHEIARFGAEVVPAVRELVAERRGAVRPSV